MTLKLSPKQGNYYKNSTAKINVSHGAVRSGKTFITNLRWLKYVRKEAPPGKLLMSGYTKNTIKENVIDDLGTIVGENNPNFEYKDGELTLYGRKIDVHGADKVHSERRIRGKTYSGWYGDEITIHHPGFVKQAITRNSKKGAKIFWTTNPDHPKNHIKVDFLDSPKMKGMLRQWHFLLEDNLTLSEEYIMMLKASFSGVFYKRNIEGLWVVADGLVYEDYDPTRHKVPHELIMQMMIDKEFDYFIAGIDWGFSHPMACGIYGVKRNPLNPFQPDYYQVAEFYQSQKQTEDLGMWIQYQNEHFLYEPVKWIWADTAEPDRILKLKAKPFSLPVIGARKGIDQGLNSVMSCFKNNRLFISDVCTNTDTELQLYRFPNEDENTKAQLATDKPLKEDDHLMDQKRYCIHNHEVVLLGQRQKHESSKEGKRAKPKRVSRARK